MFQVLSAVLLAVDPPNQSAAVQVTFMKTNSKKKKCYQNKNEGLTYINFHMNVSSNVLKEIFYHKTTKNLFRRGRNVCS